MTLKFSGLQPVEFGDKAYKPILDADKRLRLSQINFKTKNDIEKAERVMASCFGENEATVLDFLQSEMTTPEKQLLGIYLQQGEQGLKMYQDAYSKALDAQLAKVELTEDEDDN